jgi:hypothetical protein
MKYAGFTLKSPSSWPYVSNFSMNNTHGFRGLVSYPILSAAVYYSALSTFEDKTRPGV